MSLIMKYVLKLILDVNKNEWHYKTTVGLNIWNNHDKLPWFKIEISSFSSSLQELHSTSIIS